MMFLSIEGHWEDVNVSISCHFGPNNVVS